MFAVRSYMLDISRDKVPTMGTLRLIVDLLAKFGYNQFQLYTEPLVENFLLAGLLVHALDLLVVVAEVGAMGLVTGGQLHQGHNLAVAAGVLHNDGLADLAGLERYHGAGDVLRQLRHLKARCAVVAVHHHAAAVVCVLVLRADGDGLLAMIKQVRMYALAYQTKLQG